jgi:ubiquitin C-terminal hydrolase
VAYHQGDIDFQHHYARILVNGKWMEFNDSRVYVSGDVRKDREYVYLLFYRKVKNE